MNVTTARGVLKAHGIDPTADADDLTQVIGAMGWRLSLRRSQAPSRQKRPFLRCPRGDGWQKRSRQQRRSFRWSQKPATSRSSARPTRTW